MSHASPPQTEVAHCSMEGSGQRAWVGIGANLGDARATVILAAERLRPLGLAAMSGLYVSAPVQASGPDFVNAVVALDTALPATDLLRELQAIEAEFGRQRPYLNAPRTLDLDLLLMGDQRVDLPHLSLPHPRLHLRAFVLLPLLELAPRLRAPGLGALADWLPATSAQSIRRVESTPPTMPIQYIP